MEQTPSPADLVARARAALSESPALSASRVVIEHVDGALLISGSVRSYYHKQVAQEVLRPILGSVRLENRLFVHYDDVRLADEF